MATSPSISLFLAQDSKKEQQERKVIKRAGLGCRLTMWTHGSQRSQDSFSGEFMFLSSAFPRHSHPELLYCPLAPWAQAGPLAGSTCPNETHSGKGAACSCRAVPRLWADCKSKDNGNLHLLWRIHIRSCYEELTLDLGSGSRSGVYHSLYQSAFPFYSVFRDNGPQVSCDERTIALSSCLSSALRDLRTHPEGAGDTHVRRKHFC